MPNRTVNLGEQGLSDGDTIDPYLRDHFADGTEVIVPEGTYNWNGGGYGEIGDATLRGSPRATFDLGDGWNTTLELHATHGTLTVENITVRGTGCGNSNHRVSAASGATTVLQGYWLPDGSYGVNQGCAARQQGLFVQPRHGGELYVRDCWVEGFTDNGIYGTPPVRGNGGRVEVEGGLFRNNNICQVRIGTHGSVCRGVAMAVDDAIPATHNGAHNGRGVYLRASGSNLVVEDNDILMDHSHGTYPILAGSAATGGGAIRNNRIMNNQGNPAIFVNAAVASAWTGSGNEITGSGNLTATNSEGMVACRGSGCTQPTIPNRPDTGGADPPPDDGTGNGDGSGPDTGDGGGTGGGGGGTDGPTFTGEVTPGNIIGISALSGVITRRLVEDADD